MEIKTKHSIGDTVYVVPKDESRIIESKVRSINVSIYIGMVSNVCMQESYNKSSDGDRYFCLGGMVEGCYNTFTSYDEAKKFIIGNL